MRAICSSHRTIASKASFKGPVHNYLLPDPKNLFIMYKLAFLSSRPNLPMNRSQIPGTRKHKASCSAVKREAPSFWVLPQSKGALTAALERNICDFLFLSQHDADNWASLGRFNAMVVDETGHFNGGSLVHIASADDMSALMERSAMDHILIMDSADWTVIPAENLVAKFQHTPTSIFAMVSSVEEAKQMFGVLQVGVDGCVLKSNDESEIAAFAALKSELRDGVGKPLQNLTQATVTEIRPVGVGERVCVDTCSLLGEDEGLMVGSSSQATFLILSEAAKVAYVPSRPFRVNAGPVHSYCLVPGGKTKYLADLQAGDEVLIVGDGGRKCRTAVVGRCKIETRPLLLIEAQPDDPDTRASTVFVQNAETVRIASIAENEDVVAKSVTVLQKGDRLLMKVDSKARHIGIAIEEDLLEK